MEYTAYKKQKDLDLFSMEERGLRWISLYYLATKLRETVVKVD